MIADIQTGQPSGDLVRVLSIKALPTSENGWPPRPFQIVSLLDLRKYYLIPIQNLALIIEGLYWNVLEVGTVDLPALEKDRAVIAPDHAEKFKVVLLAHGKHVRYLELKES